MMCFQPHRRYVACLGALVIAGSATIGHGQEPEPPSEPAPTPALPDVPLVSGGRAFAQFEFLLKRSPFSLPTAEEQSPAADRYVLTGAANWDGVQRVFVLDKTAQSRHILEPQKPQAGMTLLEFIPDADARKMKARVQVGGEVATLAFAEPTGDASAAGANIPMPNMAQPQTPNQQVLNNPTNGQQPPPRRVFRRRIIQGNPSPVPNPPQ